METQLIKKALALTGKNLEDISDIDTYQKWNSYSIEKFFFYLISPAFQKAAYEKVFYIPAEERGNLLHAFLHKITLAMVEYQEWNKERLTSLLETICNSRNEK